MVLLERPTDGQLHQSRPLHHPPRANLPGWDHGQDPWASQAFPENVGKSAYVGTLIPISPDWVLFVFSSSVQYHCSLQCTEQAVAVLGLGVNGTGLSGCRWCNHSGLKHFCYIYIPLKSTIMVDFSLIEDIPERWTAMVIAPFYLKIRIWDWSLWSYEITVNMLFSPFVHETYMQQWLLQCIFSLNLSEPSVRKYSNPSTILLIGIMHKKVCFRV